MSEPKADSDAEVPVPTSRSRRSSAKAAADAAPDAFAVAMADIATVAKKLVDDGMGTGDAYKLAADLWMAVNDC